MKVEFRWHGDQWKKIMDRIGSTVEYAMGLHIEGIAKDYAPRDTGRLVGSITTAGRHQSSRVRSPADSGDAVQGTQDETVVGTNVEYATFVEYGTSRMDPQAFLRPAIDTFKGEALEIARVNGRSEFAKYARRPN